MLRMRSLQENVHGGLNIMPALRQLLILTRDGNCHELFTNFTCNELYFLMQDLKKMDKNDLIREIR